MPESIELSDLKHKPFFEFEKPEGRLSPQNRRKIWLHILLETIASVVIYSSYTKLVLLYLFLAPTLLGASTAALAQSMNQLYKGRLSVSKLLKFLIWGCINGCFTALWIDTLVARVDSVFYRILIDQLIGAPSFQLTFHLLGKVWDVAEPGHPSPSFSTFLTALSISYCYWPFVSIAMFVFIPQLLMFISNCVANLIWNMILSRIA
ncbi:hypothetical protein C7M61_001965 [Candidozyma pseudohaemuli]|uniref:Uncharacterized protein n=1 Tax=Candidozyma pseudohaemuli TaxID=418784 RepID=A0A2P7YTR4_9ASCO|nr:hypothetical protein C7M61_001965 [[Candida] pseudohaemulonii]PSK39355.1 hypothetical protein C7M61_001965 [[Candida] pseudohaemulonii]